MMRGTTGEESASTGADDRSIISRHPSSFATAFTLIELLAVLVIIGLLLATFVPYAMSIRETANRTRCEKNLHELYDAFAGYASSNGFLYPRTPADSTIGGAWVAFTGPDDPNPFAPTGSVQANDVTAALWLLVREGLAQPRAFVCPSGDGSPDGVLDGSGTVTVVKKRGNFRSRDNLNYAYASPFSAATDYRLNDTLPARFALIADRGPRESDVRGAGPIKFDDSPRQLRRLNSPNHHGDGQNVLYADGSVNFETSAYCGVGRTKSTDGGKPAERADGDDIFSALAAQPLIDTQPKHNEPGVMGLSVGPAYRYDTMLVPATDYPDGYSVASGDPTPMVLPAANAVQPTPPTTQATQP